MATETAGRTQTQTEDPLEPASTHPPPPSPPTSPPGRPTGRKQPPPTTPTDGKLYYRYLFKKDKTPTALLDALLRAIGKYIQTEIGDRNDPILNKSKLAAFYHAVGGDYDSLFVSAPDKSISYIWQALGVQHTLQPAEDDFVEPSIPALTLKGFVRWESLQILLGPEEHVPFVQFAVRNWALRHPDTGELFPPDLPSDAFPAVCDPQIDQWHKACAKRLRIDAAPTAERAAPTHAAATAAAASDPRLHVHFTHVPGGPPRQGPEMDYFDRQRPRVPFAHIPSRPGSHQNQSPHKHRVDSSSSSSQDERARRRRSFSDYPSPKPEKARSSNHLNPHRPDPIRRHSSQPRHVPSPPSDTDSDDAPVDPRTRIHRPVRPPVASVRVFPPESPISPPAPQRPARPSHRTELRQDDSRRRSLPSGHFGIRQKVMSFLPGSHERQRSTSRSDRDTDSRPNSARLRPDHPASRLSRRYSDEADSSDESGSDVSSKHRSHRERERELDRIRERERRERELEEERERRTRKDRAHLRPGVNRRTSSAADVDRKTREWDVRDRYRDPDRDRDHRRDARDPRGNLTGDERRRSWRERERDRERGRGGSPVVVGVGGRKYPAEGMKPVYP